MRHDSSQPIVLAVGIPAHLPYRLEDLGVGTAMPIAVGLRSDLFVAGEFAEGFVHNGLRRLYRLREVRSSPTALLVRA